MNDRQRKSTSSPCCRGAAKRRRNAGFTLIEVLAASVIVGACIAAIVSMWAFAFRLSATADRESIGYSIGRRAVEEVKQTGFQDSVEGTSIIYYDGQGGARSATRAASHAFSVTTGVSSDIMNGAQPAPGALRTITVTVTFLSTSTPVYQCSTYLARAGI